MTDRPSSRPACGSKFARSVHWLAEGFAIVAGLLLCGLSTLVVFSIVGRAIVGRPVPGDVEIVAIGTAIAVFLCLPYCQLQRANVTVDVFLAGASSRIRRALDFVGAVTFMLLGLLFAWRMSIGLVNAIRYADSSVILGIPLWWAYPPAIASFLLLAASCWLTAMQDHRRDTA